MDSNPSDYPLLFHIQWTAGMTIGLCDKTVIPFVLSEILYHVDDSPIRQMCGSYLSGSLGCPRLALLGHITCLDLTLYSALDYIGTTSYLFLTHSQPLWTLHMQIYSIRPVWRISVWPKLILHAIMKDDQTRFGRDTTQLKPLTVGTE